MQFRMPNNNEIEVRIGSINSKYITLLLYQDARVGMTILDESVGAMNWQRKHELINGNLFCSVGININYQTPEKEPYFVWKQDVGIESYTEKEKGESSDSFKRAVVNWGICRCLYSAPRIQIKRSMANVTDDGKCYDKFYVKHITYDANGCIKELQIVNNNTGVTVFETNDAQAMNDVSEFGNKTVDPEYQPKSDEDAAERCSEKQVNYIRKIVGDSENKYLQMYKVDSLEKLTKAQASALISKLK